MAPNEETPAALIDRARLAQRERRWADAEAALRRAVALVPADRAARGGLGALLLSAGAADEARAIALALRTDFPNDAAGFALGASVAANDGDLPEAENLWRAALALRPDLVAARVGLGSVLLEAGEYDAALECAAELERRRPGDAAGATMRARIEVARDGRAVAVEAWRGAAKRFPTDKTMGRELVKALLDGGRFDEADVAANAFLTFDRQEGLTQIANVLERRRPNEDHTEFWKKVRAEFPWNAPFLRRHAMNALRARRANDAAATIATLLRSGDVLLADGGLIMGLAHSYAVRGDMDALHRVVRTYLRAFDGPVRRLAALRLCRIILAYFARPDSPRRLSYRERTRRLVTRAPLKRKARALLERSIALEENLAARGPALLDTDVSRAECAALVAHVRERVARREPFSLIRINDAEGSAFPYSPALARHADADAAEREHVWWSRELVPAARAEMAEKVALAAGHADAIGIPAFWRILRDVHLDRNDGLDGRRTGRGLLSVLNAVERWDAYRPTGLPPPLLISANVHQDLQRWNLYGELFDGVREVVVVTGHKTLADTMREKFGVTIDAVVLVPTHASLRDAETQGDAPILPDVLDDVVAKVEARAPGRMVVVGAGYLGKWIVHRAKVAGGVALDLGSALDYWIGLKTRSYQDLA